MTLLKAAVVGLALALITSCAVCDTVVFQEDFSAPFVQHDWAYNNSGDSSTYGYPGVIGGESHQWPARISEDGHEILGYTPRTYSPPTTNFEDFTTGQLSGQHDWIGTGTIGAQSHSLVKGVGFANESAYRNFTPDIVRSVQYVQCYIRKLVELRALIRLRWHAGPGQRRGGSALQQQREDRGP